MNNNSYTGVVSRLFPGANITGIVRLTGGVSADVHRLDLDLADGGATSVVLRAHGASHSGHGAKLEYELLQTLYRQGVPVPEPLLVDVSGSLLKDPFLVMAFVEGSSEIPAAQQSRCIDLMAAELAKIHALPAAGLPVLPERNDPLAEVFEFLPAGSEWNALRARLRSLPDMACTDTPKLLHGDFWPENLLWHKGHIAAVLDWEDAAVGDPLSDVACARLELRYKFGKACMERFTRAYATHAVVDRQRLTLWQVYVAAAAQHFMGGWGLASDLEAHMRNEALVSIREAGAVLLDEVAI